MSTDKWTLTFNADSGSDTAASGCGPATAESGTAASYSGSVVTLDGSPDLSAVTTDHILWLDTSTGRQLFTLSAVDDTAKTVTTIDAPAGTASGLNWGIGGKRISPINTALVDLDIKAGWTIELDGGTTADYDRVSTTHTFGTEGSFTEGPITFRSTPGTGKAVMAGGTGNGHNPISFGSSQHLVVENIRFEFNQTTGAGGISFAATGHDDFLVKGCEFIYLGSGGTITAASFGKNAGGRATVIDCYFENCNYTGVFTADTGGSKAAIFVINCTFIDCADAILLSQVEGVVLEGNLIVDSTGTAIKFHSSSSGEKVQSVVIRNNTIARSTSDGISFNTDPIGLLIENNIITANGGYGITADAASAANMTVIRNNIFGAGATDYGKANTSGTINNLSVISGSFADNNNVSEDPGFTDPASPNYDFSISATSRAKGNPLAADSGIGDQAFTHTYVDPGAAQRQEPLMRRPGMAGGMNA